jgi:NAD+ synthetase
MPSPYSSPESLEDAQQVASSLGIELEVLEIEAVFSSYLKVLEEPFRDRKAGIAEENLQARVRGNLLMAFSNALGSLVLATGNKSEYAVGYATIYGDMCGGYAPIKDLYKTDVFALARWRNTIGGAPAIPPAVIARPPSAELRDNQTDQDSLPPYDVLDAILLRHIDQEQSRDEIVRAGFDAKVVDFVLRLVRISEWKRHQAAPGPKVSRRAFGRERRYPITSGWR